MINFKVIGYILGVLLIIEGMFMMACVPVGMLAGDDALMPVLFSAALTIVLGVIIWLFTRNCNKNIAKREGYIIVSLVWVVFSIFGALPFFLCKSIPSYTDAFFETISGFTTTGASILNDIESLPYTLLFWRSLTQWLGGMGIIVLSVAILPFLGIGGMQLFAAEVPGPTYDKLHPRITDTAKRLWGIYIVFTIAETVLLNIGGMSLFDSVCHSFTTMATGGYSTKQLSIGHYNSAYIQYVVTIFMVLAGINFTLSYYALHLNFKKIWKDEEFKTYIGIILGFTLVIAIVLFGIKNTSIEQSFRDSLFHVVSIITTTGFVTTDYLKWPPILTMIIFMLMFIGGSSGSTGGGIKVVRI